MYYSRTLDINISDAIWKIVRIGARPTWHIYGVSKKEYHKRMKDKGFLVKDADVLVKDFKSNKLIKIAKVLRIVTGKVEIFCCRDGEIVYAPIIKDFKFEQVMFKTIISLKKLATSVVKQFKQEALKTGDEKCRNMSSSLRMCKLRVFRVRTSEKPVFM